MGDLVLRDRKCLDYVIQTLPLVAEVLAHHVFFITYYVFLINTWMFVQKILKYPRLIKTQKLS